MAVITATAVGAAATIGGGLISANQSKQAAKGFANDAKRKEWEIQELEKKRQAIPNPYENIKDLSAIATDTSLLAKDLSGMVTNLSGINKDVSGMATNLSGMISNPYESLGVATQAAEIQIEEADISLANTLDTLRATGSGAGGATALAQAALQSKRGVAASIEQQEANNEKLKAQGRAEMQQARMAESQRLQNLQMSEAQRLQSGQLSEAQRVQAAGFGEAQRMQGLQMSEAERLQNIRMGEGARLQQAGVEGTKFRFGEQESRDIAQLNRLSGQSAQAQANQAAAKQSQNAAYGSIASGIGSIAGGVIAGGGKGFGKG
jgi:hypothetical protein